MIFWLLIGLGLVIFLLLVMAYALAVVAKRADEQMEALRKRQADG